VSTHDMRYLPYLLPWVSMLILIRSITSTAWDETAGRLVQPILRQALQMQRQIAREGRWNLTPAFLAAPQALLKVPVSFRPCKA
jgi:hypothetical protein